VLQNNCGKGKALLETIAELGIPVERSIAIGDSMNDFDMLKAAGIAVAMGNAVDEIKQISDIITTDANDAGVSAVLIDLFS
jgi:hydroxymethylpyrimidine pyrophosphatase-like HAD family hydrolase